MAKRYVYISTSWKLIHNLNNFYIKKKTPQSVDTLQNEVWKFTNTLETHTVETHIYRLRKKILNTFNDNEFILSKKNGYQIK